MIYTSGVLDCYRAYDYVKGMLNTIETVKGFRIFFENNEDYSRNVNGEKEYYRFIIINSEGDEFWVDGICGYNGVGPSCTKKMLELLGIDGDFGLFEKKEVYVNKIIQQHKMNILIENKENRNKTTPYRMLKIEFNNAYDRVIFDRVLKSIGYMNEYRHSDNICHQYDEYFKECPKTLTRYGEYRENEILTLDRRLSSYTREEVNNLIETIIVNSYKKEYSLEEV